MDQGPQLLDGTPGDHVQLPEQLLYVVGHLHSGAEAAPGGRFEESDQRAQFGAMALDRGEIAQPKVPGPGQHTQGELDRAGKVGRATRGPQRVPNHQGQNVGDEARVGEDVGVNALEGGEADLGRRGQVDRGGMAGLPDGEKRGQRRGRGGGGDVPVGLTIHVDPDERRLAEKAGLTGTKAALGRLKLPHERPPQARQMFRRHGRPHDTRQRLAQNAPRQADRLTEPPVRVLAGALDPPESFYVVGIVPVFPRQTKHVRPREGNAPKELLDFAESVAGGRPRGDARRQKPLQGRKVVRAVRGREPSVDQGVDHHGGRIGILDQRPRLLQQSQQPLLGAGGGLLPELQQAGDGRLEDCQCRRTQERHVGIKHGHVRPHARH